MSRLDELMSLSEDSLDDLVRSYLKNEAEAMYLEGADGEIFDIKEDEVFEINSNGRTAQVEWLLNYENSKELM